ncbi:phage protein NinX family protein [Escherichia coli]
MDYSQLSDFEINKRVAEVIYKDRNGLFVARNLPSKEGVTIVAEVNSEYICIAAADYCNNPADAWPIIMENMISVCAYKRANPGMKAVSWWEADSFGEHITLDDNPLRSAMIVFLMMQDANNA